MNFSARVSILLVLLSAGLSSQPAIAQTLHFIQYPGATDTYVLGVSNADLGNRSVAVGYYLDSLGAKHGFMVQGDKFTTIDSPSGTDTICWGVKTGSTGQSIVVGSYTTATGDQAFGFKNGVFQLIQPPGGVQSHAFGASASTFLRIAGDFLDSNGKWNGYVVSGSPQAPVYSPLVVPGSVESHATNTSKNGWVTLQWKDSNGHFESSLYDGQNQSFTTVNVPGATDSYAHGVDSVGDVVYSWKDAQSKTHGALLIRQSGNYTMIDPAECVNTSTNGINDFHNIVGTCEKTDGHSYGFWMVY